MRRILVYIIGLTLLNCQGEKPHSASAKVETPESQNTQVMDHRYQHLCTPEFIMGKFDPSQHPDFKRIPDQYTNKSGIYLHKEALAAFEQLDAAAKSEGIKLVIKSAARNFDYQKGIWQAKWTGARKLSNGTNAAKDIANPKERARAIMMYSAMPGTSRHHWGTDIDLNAFENSYFESGEGKKVFDFLSSRGSDFGFCRVYTAKGSERPNGYEEEKWHWTYQPISMILTDYAATAMKNEMISGFSGSEVATDLDVVNNYILGVAPSCRH